MPSPAITSLKWVTGLTLRDGVTRLTVKTCSCHTFFSCELRWCYREYQSKTTATTTTIATMTTTTPMKEIVANEWTNCFLRAASSVMLYFFVRTCTVYNQFNKCKTLQRVNAIQRASCLIHFLNGIFPFCTILVQLLSILTFKRTHFVKDLKRRPRTLNHRHRNTPAYFSSNKCQSDMMPQ